MEGPLSVVLKLGHSAEMAIAVAVGLVVLMSIAMKTCG